MISNDVACDYLDDCFKFFRALPIPFIIDHFHSLVEDTKGLYNLYTPERMKWNKKKEPKMMFKFFSSYYTIQRSVCVCVYSL